MLQRVKKLGNPYTRRSVLRSGLAAPGIVAAVLGDPLPRLPVDRAIDMQEPRGSWHLVKSWWRTSHETSRASRHVLHSWGRDQGCCALEKCVYQVTQASKSDGRTAR